MKIRRYKLSIIINIVLAFIYWWLSIVYFNPPFNLDEGEGMIASLITVYIINTICYFVFIRKEKSKKLTIFHFSLPFIMAVLLTLAFLLFWYIAMKGYELGEHIKHDEIPLRTGGTEELDELVFVPGMPGTFLTEGTIEERALTKLGKSLFGTAWHSEADIRRYEQEQRRAREPGTPVTDDSWADRIQQAGGQKKKGRTENDVYITDDGHRYIEVP